jgi:hypothetical protein
MGLLSSHESTVWREFQSGKSTGAISEAHASEEWSPAYVSRVLNRARKKITDELKAHASSHRLDVESVLDYKGMLIGFDYQANSQVYIVYTMRLGVVVWYRHESYSGKLCPDCPKEGDCAEALEAIEEEYDLALRPDERALPMTQRSTAVFNKLAAKEAPRYRRG